MQDSLVGCSVATKGAMGGARGREYYISKPGGPSSGLKGSILCLKIVYFNFWGMNKT
jgi:hypothetical protein